MSLFGLKPVELTVSQTSETKSELTLEVKYMMDLSISEYLMSV